MDRLTVPSNLSLERGWSRAACNSMTRSKSKIPFHAAFAILLLSIIVRRGYSLEQAPSMKLPKASSSPEVEGVPDQLHTRSADVSGLDVDPAAEDARPRKKGLYMPLARKVRSGGPTYGVDIGYSGISRRKLEGGSLIRDTGELTR